jgi:5-methylcytosine-specific restriction endonuclease McrA
MVKIASETDRPWTDRETLHRLYVEKDMTLEEVGNRLGCSGVTVYKWCEELGVEKPWRDEQILRDHYYGRGFTMAETAEVLDCSLKAVRRGFRTNGISLRDGWRTGRPRTENPNIYYGSEWPTQREKALERDGYKCNICSMTNETHRERFGGKSLHVHHKIPFVEFEDPEEANRLTNLKTLCVACHNSLEHREEPWFA